MTQETTQSHPNQKPDGKELAPMHAWLCEPLKSDAKEAIDRMRRFEDVVQLAVMPDVHPGEDACVGVVMATDRLVYPMAIGGDIGCGITAAALDVPGTALRDARIAQDVLTRLAKGVPIMRHRRSEITAIPDPDLNSSLLSDPSLATEANRDGVLELGTLGRGNHFLELQQDQEGRMWVMIHSGSRAMGQAVTKHHLRFATPMRGGMAALDIGTDAGRAYMNDLAWARRYAAANRRRMLDSTLAILGEILDASVDPDSIVDTDHNHARLESHEGRTLLVHRKGASSARDSELGLIPGSMGTSSYHVTGRGCPASLHSSSHGAGRALSRSKARAKIRSDDLRRQMREVHYDVRATARLVEESPGAYKDIAAVMRAQRELVRIERVLKPLLVYKGT